MADPMLAPDRVTLLLALVPYIREHGPTPVTEVAAAFAVEPGLVRELVAFLGTAGVPGETLTYQPEDLFDIDWDGLIEHDMVSLTRIVAVDNAPRFAPAETAALVAGLQALVPVLPAEQSDAARRLTAKLAHAFGGASRSAPTVTSERRDARVAEIFAAISAGSGLAFDYRDAAGRASSRTVDPIVLTQGPGAWYLRAYCRDRAAERTFRVDHIAGLHAVPGRRHVASASDQGGDASAIPLEAAIAAAALPRLHAFTPEVIGEAPDGRVRVRVSVWHLAAAATLLQQAPGDIEILAPEAARAAVQSWAQRALAAYEA